GSRRGQEESSNDNPQCRAPVRVAGEQRHPFAEQRHHEEESARDLPPVWVCTCEEERGHWWRQEIKGPDRASLLDPVEPPCREEQQREARKHSEYARRIVLEACSQRAHRQLACTQDPKEGGRIVYDLLSVVRDLCDPRVGCTRSILQRKE